MSVPQKSAVLITGGARRIGRAIALCLAKSGYDIALHYSSSKADALNLRSQIQQQGVRCEILAADLSNEKAASTLVARARKIFPDLRVLINNASIFTPSKWDLKDLEVFNTNLNINFKAPFILTCAFAQVCQSGNIINLLDTNIVKNQTAHVAYLLSKKALAALTEMSAAQLGPKIRVNGVCPGLILPPEGKTADYLHKRAQSIPLKRVGDLKYITQAVEFLLINEFITGQVIFVDGGEHLI